MPRSRVWYFNRFDRLVRLGFTPEEASIIANVAMSRTAIRRLIMQRVSRIDLLVSRGMSRADATALVQQRVRQEGKEIINWSQFREILYPSNKGAI